MNDVNKNQIDDADAESSLESSTASTVEQLENLQAKVDEYQDKMLRTQAEMENLRKRSEREVSNAHKYAIEKFATEMLQVKDSLELGLTAEDIDLGKLQEGTELTLKMLGSLLEKFEIIEIDPTGEVFDPNLHEAMTIQVNEKQPPNTVITTIQKGYTLRDRLLRPAMVIVSKSPEA